MQFDDLWETLEAFSSTAFLIAGTILLLFAALLGAEAVLEITTPNAVFGTAGYVFAFIGLLGLFRQLAEDNHWLARAGVLFALFGALGATVAAVAMLGVSLGLLGEEVPAWGMLPIALHGTGMVFGYLAPAIAGLRGENLSNTVSALLFAPTFLFIAMFASSAGEITPFVPFVLAIVQALVHLAIGVVLRNEGALEGEAARGTEAQMA